MNDSSHELLSAFETHAVERIETLCDAGLDVTAPILGKSPVSWLIEMYFRSDRFADCLRLLLARGATLDDPKLEAVLLNDPDLLERAIRQDAGLLHHRTSLVCAFTPLVGASLLHVAAEYGHLAVASTLLEAGAIVDAPAARGSAGMNGHTPLFHTVNSNENRSAAVMKLLLEAGARTDVRLAGITWGQGFPWETTVFDVTPISYAQFGLLPQMHRAERDTYANITAMLEASGRTVPALGNVPNRYLHSA